MTLPSFGLIGKMGSGKSTAANVLVRTHGYVPLSFAAPLKAMVIEADPLVEYECDGGIMGACDGPVPVHLSDILASGKTFEQCKREYPEVRRSLQRIGQSVRKMDPDYWVRVLLQDVGRFEYEQVPTVVADVRYPNEADALRKNGFKLVRIARPASPAGMTTEETRASLHSSETALDGYSADATINNSGDVTDLIGHVLDLV